jgi:hypothetical protein
MNRLRRIIFLLSAALAAVIAHTSIDGPKLLGDLSGALIVVLLLCSLALRRQGLLRHPRRFATARSGRELSPEKSAVCASRARRSARTAAPTTAFLATARAARPGGISSREERKCLHVPRPHGTEVALVERRDHAQRVPLSQRDN